MSEWTEGVFRHMNARLVKDTQRCRRDEWTNWAEGKVNAIRNRTYKRKANKSNSIQPDTWKDCCAWMLARLRSKATREQNGPWYRWAEAIASLQRIRFDRCPAPRKRQRKYISDRFEPKEARGNADSQGKVKAAERADREAAV